jgi:hypothetical protein
MLLELWIASTSATGLTWYFGKRLQKQLETPNAVQEVHAENAVELSVPERNYHPPVYVGTGNPALIGIPIGGGFSDSEKPLFHSTWTGTNWIVGKNLDLERPTHQWWVNTPNDLQQLLESKNISSSSFPASLPLKVSEVRYAKGTPLWHHPPSRLLHSNKDILIRKIVQRKTFGSFWGTVAATCAAITSVCLVADWDTQKHRIRLD